MGEEVLWEIGVSSINSSSTKTVQKFATTPNPRVHTVSSASAPAGSRERRMEMEVVITKRQKYRVQIDLDSDYELDWLQGLVQNSFQPSESEKDTKLRETLFYAVKRAREGS